MKKHILKAVVSFLFVLGSLNIFSQTSEKKDYIFMSEFYTHYQNIADYIPRIPDSDDKQASEESREAFEDKKCGANPLGRLFKIIRICGC